MAENLSNKISLLLNSAPTSFDPEDDADEDTKAHTDHNHEENGSDNELNISKFRKQNVALLEEIDQRYHGKKASRKSLQDDDLESEEVEDEEDNAEEDNVLSTEESNEDLEEEEDEGEASENSDDDDDEDDNKRSYLDNDEADNTKVFSTPEFSSPSNKSFSVRQQLSMWENLLEMRIQMQKCLHSSNKFPQLSNFKDLQSNSKEFCDKAKDTKGHVQNLLDKFLQLQVLLLRKYPETKKILSADSSNKVESSHSDEEIPSDTDEETENNSDDETDKVSRKKMKLSDYKEEMSSRFGLYRNYRNSVLQKWHDKTRIASNKSENVHSITQQINHILNNKDKLVKATQLKRTDYSIVGEKEEANGDKPTDVYNSNIFDDTEFYHHLLRELIEFKSADLTDPIKLSRQWVQLQKLRSKMKKKVDTKATKGRKIRYVVHPKLVNFMAPVEDLELQESAKTELYNSLFGKNRPCPVA